MTQEAQREKFSTWETGTDKLEWAIVLLIQPNKWRSGRKAKSREMTPKNQDRPQFHGNASQKLRSCSQKSAQTPIPWKCFPKMRTDPNPIDNPPQKARQTPNSWECSPKSRMGPHPMEMLPKTPWRCSPKIRTDPNPMDICPKKQYRPQTHEKVPQKSEQAPISWT